MMVDNMNTAFTTDYKRLNKEQKAAVDAIEGPVLVVAGPGTGKTQILTLRIANILLQTDTAPEQILALTFTESGQKAMRERLAVYLGKDAYRVPIFTFHGFAASVIAEYPESFPVIAGGRLATEIDKISIIKELLESDIFRALKPLGKPELFVKDIVSIIGNLKQEYVTPERLVEVVSLQEEALQETVMYHEKGAHKGKVRGEYKDREKQLKKNKELLELYSRYEAVLRERTLYDFDDMLVLLVTALREDESLRLELQERYQYILADEHQDVNGTQNELLELLMSYHDFPNIFAVGDEKQAIFRFQGASLENFLRFEETFTGTKRIELRTNYRSTQDILDTAHDLIAVEEGPLAKLRVPLVAHSKDKGKLGLLEFSHEAVEDSFLVEDIKAQIAAKVAPSEISVILKTNRDVAHVSALLQKAGVPVFASADRDVLEAPLTQYIMSLLHFVQHPQDEVRAAEVLQYPFWDIAPVDVFTLLSSRSIECPLSKLLFTPGALETLTLEAPEKVQAIAKVVKQVQQAMLTKTPTETLAILLEKSGLLSYVLSHDPFEGVRVVRRLYDEFESFSQTDTTLSLSGALAKLDLLKAYNISLSAQFINDDTDAVRVMTAHKSKGLEFEVVYIPYLKDAAWGGRQHRQTFKIPLRLHVDAVKEHAQDDELRLLYVAMTRAKRELRLSYSALSREGKELALSRLLLEINETKLPTLDALPYEKHFTPLSVLEQKEIPITKEAVFRARFVKKGFSATSCNNYFESPWLYFYRNLLQVPELPENSLRYGTAVHAVLDAIEHRFALAGTWPEFSVVEKEISRQFGKLPITKETYAALHQQALEELVVAYEALKKRTTHNNVRSEVSVNTVLKTGLAELPEIPLTGKLDRVEYEDGIAVKVLDFKTGSPKSKNEIIGATKNSNGNYHRQLVFYALLLNTFEEREIDREGTLFFVKPTGQGEIKEETFIITPADVDELRQLLIGVAKKVIEGTILDEVPPADFSYRHLLSFWKEE